MEYLFFILFFLSIFAFIIGLVKPTIFKISTRKQSSILFGSLIFIFLILFGITAPEVQKEIFDNTSQIQTTENVEGSNNDSVQSESTDNNDFKDDAISNTQNSDTNKSTEEVKKTESSNFSFYSVTQVVDGDTIKVNLGGKEETLRLIGLDTPETVDPRKPVQCFGKEASNKARELLSGKKVRIEKDSTQGDRDKYGRLLTYIYREDGLFYNKYMIEQGYAHEYTYGTSYKYQSEFKTAQKNAQTSQLGLWSPNTCNGDTTSSANPTTQQTATTNTQSSSGLYYTSSHYTSKYYYPESCDGWKGLSPTYLKLYNTLEALLVVYPTKTKSPQCN